MGRRQAREVAFKALFQVEMGGAQPDFAFSQLLLDNELSENDVEFAEQLIEGVITNWADLDTNLTKVSTEWSLERMANADRVILRMASFELFHRPDIPTAVAISEAVELAKLYSTAESGRFVNGVLGALAKISNEQKGLGK